MNHTRTGFLFLVVSSLVACGSQVVDFAAGPDGGTAAPTVTSTVPLNLATGVALDSSIAATFSRAMDSATINTTTFKVAQGATPVSGAVAFNGATRTATFTPDAPLRENRVYTATVTTGATDTGGLPLAADHVWSFTTAAVAGPPTVISTTPLDLATDVSVNKKPTATFNKAMDSATINTTTFTVAQGATPVAGSVTFDSASDTATFTPNAPLGLGLVYTATITTGARDAGGTALAANHSWSFTTGLCSQVAVVLGSAANFAVLAGSTVTNTGITSVTGDLGVSPGTGIVGFPPGIVIGAQHSADPAAAAGIADLTTAYIATAGLTLCPIPAAGNIGGQTLTPGLYKSTSGLEITSGDLTLDAQGDADAVFIFQMASTFTTTDRQVILAGGAKSSNVFWQVGTSATLGTGTIFHGTIMADQAITLNTGARLTGRALARIAGVSLNANTIVRPAP